MPRSPQSSTEDAPVITPTLLREWPLPLPAEEGDKESRGRVLLVGGSTEVPGGILLAAEAALRAGAGKLRVAVPAGIRAGLAIAVPESRVYALPEAEDGAISEAAADKVAELANHVGCVVFGPGVIDQSHTADLVRQVIPKLENATVVLDAAALSALAETPDLLHCLDGNAIITPHAGEMATCLSIDKAEVARDPMAAARHAAERYQCVVVQKGSETHIASPGGRCYSNRAGNVGLATSGSGDTLAGIIGGLGARGADPLQAAVWGVYLHACAGDRLAERVGTLGFLARELLAEIPRLMDELRDDR